MIDLRPQISGAIGGLILLLGIAVGIWGYVVGFGFVYAKVNASYLAQGKAVPKLSDYAKACFQQKPCRDTYALTPWNRMPNWQRALVLVGIFVGALLTIIGGSWKPALEAHNRARLEALRQNSVPDLSARGPEKVAA